MKYSVHGFYQPKAVELGLSNDDLLVLRWFVDFAGTDKMRTIIEPDGIYYWINYSTVLEDLPVLQISKDRLQRKHFKKLCDVNVLKHKHVKQGGSFSYYAYGLNYDALIYLQNATPYGENNVGYGENDVGYGENDVGGTVKLPQGYGENNGTKINLLNNPSINKSLEEIYKEEKTSKKFKPPTVEEVAEYCKERKNDINPQKFIDFYTSKGWMIGKNRMKDWKAAIRTWENSDKKSNIAPIPEWLDKKIEKEEYQKGDDPEYDAILDSLQSLSDNYTKPTFKKDNPITYQEYLESLKG